MALVRVDVSIAADVGGDMDHRLNKRETGGENDVIGIVLLVELYRIVARQFQAHVLVREKDPIVGVLGRRAH